LTQWEEKRVKNAEKPAVFSVSKKRSRSLRLGKYIGLLAVSELAAANFHGYLPSTSNICNMFAVICNMLDGYLPSSLVIYVLNGCGFPKTEMILENTAVHVGNSKKNVGKQRKPV
jgi:hypothetical protein